MDNGRAISVLEASAMHCLKIWTFQIFMFYNVVHQKGIKKNTFFNCQVEKKTRKYFARSLRSEMGLYFLPAATTLTIPTLTKICRFAHWRKPFLYLYISMSNLFFQPPNKCQIMQISRLFLLSLQLSED